MTTNKEVTMHFQNLVAKLHKFWLDDCGSIELDPISIELT